jgi:hypothetical protein
MKFCVAHGDDKKAQKVEPAATLRQMSAEFANILTCECTVLIYYMNCSTFRLLYFTVKG